MDLNKNLLMNYLNELPYDRVMHKLVEDLYRYCVEHSENNDKIKSHLIRLRKYGLSDLYTNALIGGNFDNEHFAQWIIERFDNADVLKYKDLPLIMNDFDTIEQALITLKLDNDVEKIPNRYLIFYRDELFKNSVETIEEFKTKFNM